MKLDEYLRKNRKAKRTKTPAEKAAAKANREKHERHFAGIMRIANLDFGMIAQYKAIGDRDYRWDFAWPDLRILVEIHGGEFARKRQGHATGTGMIRDCEKMNLAASNGWTCLAFTGKMLRNESAVIEAMRRVIERNEMIVAPTK